MPTGIYCSTVSRWWTDARQDEILAARVPGWPDDVVVWEDDPTPGERRAHRGASLCGRAAMLRDAAGPDWTIHVCSLSSLAWNEADLVDVLRALALSGTVLVAHDDGVSIPPDRARRVVSAFLAACHRARIEGASRKGAAIAAAGREARTAAACELIRERWSLSSRQHPTRALLAEADVSLNTAKKHLMARPDAQAVHRMALTPDQLRARKGERAAARRREVEDRAAALGIGVDEVAARRRAAARAAVLETRTAQARARGMSVERFLVHRQEGFKAARAAREAVRRQARLAARATGAVPDRGPQRS